METENFTVSSQQTTASPISFAEQDLSVDDIYEGVIEMEEEYGKHDQRKFKGSRDKKVINAVTDPETHVPSDMLI